MDDVFDLMGGEKPKEDAPPPETSNLVVDETD